MDRIVGIVAGGVVLLLAIVGVIAYAVHAYSANNVNAAIANSTYIHDKAHASFGSALHAIDYSGMNNSVAINARIVPDSMLKKDGTIYGPWRNSIVTLSGSNDGAQFIETWTNVGADDCAQFAASSGANQVTVNGQTIANDNRNANTQIASACGGSIATISFAWND